MNTTETRPSSPSPSTKRRGRDVFGVFANVRETGIFVFIILLIVVISLRTSNFLNVANFRDILLDISILVIIAIGQTMVIITHGIDLSLGSAIGLSAMTVGVYLKGHPDTSPAAALLMGIGLGALMGSFNGLLVTVGKIPPIIVTLGTLSIFRGLLYVVGQGAWVNADELSEPFKHFTTNTLFGIPYLVLYAAVAVLIFFYFLNYSRTGRQIYAVGGNPIAAQQAGIRMNRINYLVFLLSGVLAGAAGVFWLSRFANAANNTALGWELQSVAAAVVGGVSIAGGTGTVPGVVLGSLVLGIINNAVNLVGISPFVKQALYGLVILLAVILDSVISRRLQKVLTARRTV